MKAAECVVQNDLNDDACDLLHHRQHLKLKTQRQEFISISEEGEMDS